LPRCRLLPRRRTQSDWWDKRNRERCRAEQGGRKDPRLANRQIELELSSLGESRFCPIPFTFSRFPSSQSPSLVNTVPISSVLSVSSDSKPRRSPNETAQCMNSKPQRT